MVDLGVSNLLFLGDVGSKLMSQVALEGHVAPNCMSRISRSSSETPKPNFVMNSRDFGRTKKTRNAISSWSV